MRPLGSILGDSWGPLGASWGSLLPFLLPPPSFLPCCCCSSSSPCVCGLRRSPSPFERFLVQAASATAGRRQCSRRQCVSAYPPPRRQRFSIGAALLWRSSMILNPGVFIALKRKKPSSASLGRSNLPLYYYVSPSWCISLSGNSRCSCSSRASCLFRREPAATCDARHHALLTLDKSARAPDPCVWLALLELRQLLLETTIATPLRQPKRRALAAHSTSDLQVNWLASSLSVRPVRGSSSVDCTQPCAAAPSSGFERDEKALPPPTFVMTGGLDEDKFLRAVSAFAPRAKKRSCPLPPLLPFLLPPPSFSPAAAPPRPLAFVD